MFTIGAKSQTTLADFVVLNSHMAVYYQRPSFATLHCIRHSFTVRTQRQGTRRDFTER